MSIETRKTAIGLVDAILANLKDRAGLGDELEQISEEVYDEMRAELIALVERRLM